MSWVRRNPLSLTWPSHASSWLRKLGATRGVNPSRVDPINAVHEATRGAGLDRVVVASAGTAATVGLALKLVAPLGLFQLWD
ncbi:hypothetical protein HS121_17760 [bacterium]|nr:hypothetical protein [bacterium]